MSAVATIRACDLPLVLAAAKARQFNHGRTCQLAALSAGPVIQIDCHHSSRWTRPGLIDDVRRFGISPASVLPMQRGHIGRLYERIQRERGRREVLQTWGTGVRRLLAEPLQCLNGGKA